MRTTTAVTGASATGNAATIPRAIRSQVQRRAHRARMTIIRRAGTKGSEATGSRTIAAEVAEVTARTENVATTGSAVTTTTTTTTVVADAAVDKRSDEEDARRLS